MIQGLGLDVWIFGVMLRVSGLGIKVQGYRVLGFRVWGLGFRV